MAAWAVLKRDLLRWRRAPVRLLLVLGIVLVPAALFALVFSGGGEMRIRVLIFNEDEGLLARMIENVGENERAAERLELISVGPEGYDMMEGGEASALVHIPAGFTDDVLAGRPTTVEVVKNPAEAFLPQVVEEGVVLGGVALSELSRLFRPELDTLSEMIDADSAPADAFVAGFSIGINRKIRRVERYLLPPPITIETGADEKEEEASGEGPSAAEILGVMLPGLALMGVLFLAQMATRDMVRERETGLLKQLLTAPVTPGGYIGGKCLSSLVLTAGGFVVLIGLGWAAGVDWGPAPAVAALVAAGAVGSTGVMILIMSLVGTERQGDAVTTILVIVWAMLGGAFVPLPAIPGFLRPVAQTSLVYWVNDGFLALRDGGGLGDVVVNAAVVAGVGLALLAAGALVIRRRIDRGRV